MQAIARVNRVFKDKPGGLVVDYLGLAHELKQALATYTESGGTGKTAIDQEEAVAVMLEKFEVCRDFMHGFDWSIWKTGTPAQRLGLLPLAQEHVLSQAKKEKEPDQFKQKFLRAVTELSQAFALAIPNQKAIAIRDDVGFFQAVRAAIAKSTVAGKEKSPEDVDAAIRQIISRAVASSEVVDIFAAGLKKPRYFHSLGRFSFRGARHATEKPGRRAAPQVAEQRNQGKVQEIPHPVQVLRRDPRASDPQYQNRAIEAAAVIEELIRLAKEMREAEKRGEGLGLTEDEVAFYDAFEVNDSAVKVLGEPTLKTIAHELVQSIRTNVTIDWTEREAVRAKIRVAVKRILRKHGYPPDKQEKATELVLQQAELLCADWAG